MGNPTPGTPNFNVEAAFFVTRSLLSCLRPFLIASTQGAREKKNNIDLGGEGGRSNTI